MKTAAIGSVSFGRALSSQEELDFIKTAKEAKSVLKIDEGTTLFKIYTPSMPAPVQSDTGQGKLSSPYTRDYLRTMSVYTGLDAIKIMPNGKFDKNGDVTPGGNKYSSIPYLRQSLTLGEDTINIEELTTPEWGNIVPKNEFKKLTDNNARTMRINRVNYENELGETKDYPILKPLKNAYNSVINPQNNVQADLKKEFEEFKKKPINKFYDRIAIVPFMEKGELPFDFFENFDKSPQKQEQFESLKQKHSEDIDFFKFNQFIALKQQNKVKKELNAQGKELWGDCLIGFGKNEILAFPDAFEKNKTIGWGFSSIKYDEILDKNSEAHKLFNQKLEFFFENYDGVRFDVGWAYVNPKIIDVKNGNRTVEHKQMDDKILNYIDETAKRVKGESFDTKKLVYEADAAFEDFHFINPETMKVEPFLKNHTLVLTSQYQNLHGWDGLGWNNPEFFEKISLDNYTIGHNHDTQNLRLFSENLKDENRKYNTEVLSKLLKLPKETLQNPEEFVKAKFAELFLAKNQYMMFYDVMGRKDVLDTNTNSSDTYRTRLGNDWEQEFHSNLQKNRGFNLMEALGSAMKAKGKDKEYPQLYEKINKFARILRDKGALTRQEADNNEKIVITEPKEPKIENLKSGSKINKKYLVGFTALIGGALAISKFHDIKNNENKDNAGKKQNKIKK